MVIKREDVVRFIKEGKRFNNGKGQEPVVGARVHSGPFLVSVSHYLASQLALDINHSGISLSRVACGAFALGKEGKLKIFVPVLPTEEDEDDAEDPMGAATKETTTTLVHGLLSLASNQIQDHDTVT